jgi:hypothetical protein
MDLFPPRRRFLHGDGDLAAQEQQARDALARREVWFEQPKDDRGRFELGPR